MADTKKKYLLFNNDYSAIYYVCSYTDLSAIIWRLKKSTFVGNICFQIAKEMKIVHQISNENDYNIYNDNKYYTTKKEKKNIQ